ncbi:sugar phosphate isomerase/epimerase [Rhodoferax sp. PAMC 29310]|uniref:sugar phosphate isomerase/epimerase family protein n=1 Tax=Rhodoferax sp. PAMC 29310 TaxID=2822760 RepID=UPI001F0AB8ED|nr:glutamine ABC transporter ATP-binding protein [Rhodoferax sp. PAMC 29310]
MLSTLIDRLTPDLAPPALPEPIRALTVLISLSSFGAAEVRRHGQLWFSQLSFDAGADGVEVRSELIVDELHELAAIRQLACEEQKALVYSCALPLWDPIGELDSNALNRAIQATLTLGATRLKMSIGGFKPSSRSTLDTVHAMLKGLPFDVVIENDHTVAAGSLPALQHFFVASRASPFKPGMTFDVGNWHWAGECPLLAAQSLSCYVAYIHCKGVQRLPRQWVAVPLSDSSAPWRAVLRALPQGTPWAIEYPLIGDDLLQVTRDEIAQLRHIAATLHGPAPVALTLPEITHHA